MWIWTCDKAVNSQYAPSHTCQQSSGRLDDMAKWVDLWKGLQHRWRSSHKNVPCGIKHFVNVIGVLYWNSCSPIMDLWRLSWLIPHWKCNYYIDVLHQNTYATWRNNILYLDKWRKYITFKNDYDAKDYVK